MAYTETMTLKEVAELIADSILEDRILTRESIVCKIVAYSNSFMGIKNKPKEMNRRIKRIISRKEKERRFWFNKVKSMCSEAEFKDYCIELYNELTKSAYIRSVNI